MRTIKLPTGTYEYDPRSPLGKAGGFGAVFLGRMATGEEVAVKKLHLTAAAAAYRELTIAQELKGRTLRHVMPFIDAGEDAESGDYFVVMPRATQSLQAAIENDGMLSADAAAGVLLQVIGGLREVDDLVHRDLKPDNILFHGNAWKVADFGIARFIEDATASDTLKNCLSPYYAAPEQWRMERATHATDVYSLGCVAFCLLTGHPPFTQEPERQHQQDAAPAISCPDGRLVSVINQMLRKRPETRPSLSRAQAIIEQICSSPLTGVDYEAFSSLAGAGARVAQQEQERQAAENAATVRRLNRDRLAEAGREILNENLERLWGKIHSNAPAAQRTTGSRFDVALGQGKLSVEIDPGAVPEGAFKDCGWDVIASACLVVKQSSKPYVWSTSLWYAKLSGEHDYRWNEVGYFRCFSRVVQYAPYSLKPGREAVLAAGPGMHSVSHAIGPWKCDDEEEGKFHERVAWLVARAAGGQLGYPSTLPILTWPPSLNVGYP